MEKLNEQTYFTLLAQLAALRSTCPRRQDGVVAVSDGAEIATGYPSSVRGLGSCCDPGVGCLLVPGRGCIRTLPAIGDCLAKAAGRRIDAIYTVFEPDLPSVQAMLSFGVPVCFYWQPSPSPSPSDDRDEFIQGVGLGPMEGEGLAGWLRRVECPPIWELTGVPRVSMEYGECPRGCGHVFCLGDLPSGIAGAGMICPRCSPVSWNGCAVGSAVRYADGLRRVLCAACEGTGQVPEVRKYIGQRMLAPTVCLECDGSGEVRRVVVD